MQAACWYVLLLLQPTVYLVSRDRSGPASLRYLPNLEAKQLG